MPRLVSGRSTLRISKPSSSVSVYQRIPSALSTVKSSKSRSISGLALFSAGSVATISCCSKRISSDRSHHDQGDPPGLTPVSLQRPHRSSMEERHPPKSSSSLPLLLLHRNLQRYIRQQAAVLNLRYTGTMLPQRCAPASRTHLEACHSRLSTIGILERPDPPSAHKSGGTSPQCRLLGLCSLGESTTGLQLSCSLRQDR